MSSHKVSNQSHQHGDGDNEQLDTVWKLITNIDYCMMVTYGDGKFLSRPMSSIVRRKQNQIAFLSEMQSHQVASIKANGYLLLSYSDGRSFVAVRGDSVVSHDAQLIKDLWNPGAQAFWPEGPEKSKVVAILVTPDSAEYWHSSNSIVSTVKFLFALATKTSPDMGENARVTM